MAPLVRDRVAKRARPAWRGRSRIGLVVLAGALLHTACGKSSPGSDDDPTSGDGGSSGSVSGTSAGGGSAGGGKAGSAGGGRAGNGSAGRGGMGASGGTAGLEATGGAEDSGGVGGSSGSAATSGRAGDTSGGAGETSGGSGGSAASAGTTSEGGSAGAIELPPEFEPLAAVFCATARNCCEAAGQPTGPLAECEAMLAEQNETFRAVKRGTVLIDTDALGACIDSYRDAAANCTRIAPLAACHGIFIGTLADGEPCRDVAECDRSTADKTCEIVQEDNPDPYLGTCRTTPRAGLDELCAGDCREGSSCSFTSISGESGFPIDRCYEEDGLYCRSGYGCEELLDDGAECTYSTECGSGNRCDVTCKPLVEPGGECFFTPDCQPGFICVERECVIEPFASIYDTCLGKILYFD